VSAHGAISDQVPERVSVRTVLRRYYEQRAIHQASAQQAYYALKLLDPYFGELYVSEVTPALQRQWIDKMRADRYSDGYIRRVLAVLKAAFSRAVREGELQHAPHIELPQESDQRERVANRWEMAQLLAAAKTDRLQLYLLFGLLIL